MFQYCGSCLKTKREIIYLASFYFFKRGEPGKLPLNRAIHAWKEGLQLMRVGAKNKFFCPSDLAYGKKAQGPIIGPNAVLIFEVELLNFDPSKKPSSPI